MNLHIDNGQDIYTSSRIYKENWLQPRFGYIDHLVQIDVFISCEKWVGRRN
jgi:hypothetical protein